jgi:hypothetical protein
MLEQIAYNTNKCYLFTSYRKTVVLIFSRKIFIVFINI